MRKKWIPFVLFFGAILIGLTACGEKSEEDVSKKLQSTVKDLEGYKAKANMKMNTGEKTQSYDLDVWYKDKDYYKVSLQNPDDEKGNQVILKNKDGVFVLTPALNKNFKFQADWPETSSQPYLFQSLVKDIMKDEEKTFESTDDQYVYKTKTNYQSNNNLPKQEIQFSKKDYTPERVKVMDKDKDTVVEVEFTEFKVDPSFKKDDFEMKQKEDSESASATPKKGEVKPLSITLPEETAGAELKEKKEMETENGNRAILTYEGKRNFTIIEEKDTSVPTLNQPKEVKGEIVNLGSTIGAIDGNTVQWSERGVEYKLASEELTKKELIDVAKSMHQKATK